MIKYYLIFSDSKTGVVRVEKHTLNEVYQFVIDNNMIEGSYFIIKGNKVI